jgi:DNA helicase HerA-like ATPase
MYTDGGIYLGLADGQRVTMALSMANRHGLIAGASGTGKTVTMKVLAESFSDAGVPVFLCDIKGDVSGLAEPGARSDGMEKRIDRFGLRDCFQYRAYPVTFWDVYQECGHPVRAAVSDMGPDLLSRILGLTPAQEGVLNIVFRVADDNGLLLTDLKDLKAMLGYVGDHREELLTVYGNVSAQSLGGILRALLPLEAQGGELFFGEPCLDIMDLIRTDAEGHGVINLLDCVRLARNPKLYATFLLWLMSELFERLPEAGDLAKPKLVFFFDEAHMLFSDAPKLLVQKIEQMVKLIRSKGVGVYFVTQSPSDIPDSVLAQLSGRIQHALRAYTPAEQKAVRAAAGSMRPNPAFKTEDVIQELGVGEALISLLDENGVPGVTQRAAVICPQSLMAPCGEATRGACTAADGMGKDGAAVDNESAFELLERRREEEESRAALEAERAAFEKEKAAFEAKKKKEEDRRQAAYEREVARRKAQIERQVINTGSQIIRRGLMNTLFGGRR